jgi:filamentous hemagglutinin family protein
MTLCVGSACANPGRFVTLCVFGLVWAAQCNAQITLDGSLGPKQKLIGPNFTIDSDQGVIRGTNLFHSFGRFNVRHNESATFTNIAGGPVANILSRVTGGERSFIDGVVRSTISGANLYLLNPAGVMFGPNAALDVSGAFHVTTANYLRLADGGIFHAGLEQGSKLTVAQPVAFGFLNASPAAVSLDRATLQVPAGGTLSVVAGDATLTGATLRAAGGRLHLVSVASAGEVVPSAGSAAPDLDVSSFARMGQLQLSAGANVTVSSATGAGTVLIRSGRLIVEGGEINANTSVAGNAAPLGVDIRVRDDIVLSAPAQVLATSQGGSAGEIRIAASRLQMKNGAFIQNANLGAANGGNVTIDVDTLELANGSVIFVPTSASGKGGDLSVNAGSITMTGSSFSGRSTGIFAQTSGAGASGTLTVTSRRLDMSGNTSISNASGGPGPGGTLKINVDGDISITGSDTPGVFTGLFANAFSIGQGGTLDVTSRNLSLANHATIQAGSFAQGNAGGATVRTGRLEISSASSIFASALFSSGSAGNLEVTADTIIIRGVKESADPSSTTDFTGLSTAAGVNAKKGGDISVTANSILITDKGAVSSVSLGAGDAGKIKVTAESLTVNEKSQISSSTRGSGRGGNIEIQANNVTVSGAGAPLGPADSLASAIGAQAAGSSGAAGDITIKAGTLQVLDGAKITTQTFGPGKGGNIAIDAGSVVVSGINAPLDAFQRSTPGADPDGGRSTIASSSERLLLGDAATGSAGSVRITGGDLQVLAGGAISSSTNTPGRGGNIDVTADRVSLLGSALISADSTTSTRAGNAGDISIEARESIHIGASSVTTAADRAAGGAIRIAANQIQLADGAIVSAKSSGTGNAGSINIIAGDTLLMRNSTVSTEATLADGGNVMLIAPTRVHLIDSTLSTSVGTGQGKGGNISIDPEFVILDRSQIRADAFGGPGGSIGISADVFLTQDSVLSASSTLSTPGTIDIQARITDVSGNVGRLPESAPVTAPILRASCAARLAGGSISTLVVAGREGLPPEPGGMLPSPLLADDAAIRPLSGETPVRQMSEPPRFSLLAADRLCSGFGSH